MKSRSEAATRGVCLECGRKKTIVKTVLLPCGKAGSLEESISANVCTWPRCGAQSVRGVVFRNRDGLVRTQATAEALRAAARAEAGHHRRRALFEEEVARRYEQWAPPWQVESPDPDEKWVRDEASDLDSAGWRRVESDAGYVHTDPYDRKYAVRQARAILAFRDGIVASLPGGARGTLQRDTFSWRSRPRGATATALIKRGLLWRGAYDREGRLREDWRTRLGQEVSRVLRLKEDA